MKFDAIDSTCRGGASRQLTDQWRQRYVFTSQITGVTNTSLDSALGWGILARRVVHSVRCFLSVLAARMRVRHHAMLRLTLRLPCVMTSPTLKCITSVRSFSSANTVMPSFLWRKDSVTVLPLINDSVCALVMVRLSYGRYQIYQSH